MRALPNVIWTAGAVDAQAIFGLVNQPPRVKMMIEVGQGSTE
jgi:hypothetical protein